MARVKPWLLINAVPTLCFACVVAQDAQGKALICPQGQSKQEPQWSWGLLLSLTSRLFIKLIGPSSEHFEP